MLDEDVFVNSYSYSFICYSFDFASHKRCLLLSLTCARLCPSIATKLIAYVCLLLTHSYNSVFMTHFIQAEFLTTKNSCVIVLKSRKKSISMFCYISLFYVSM